MKVGEYGCPVAAVERGKQVIVGQNQVFAVADHDFTKLSLIPSVIFFVDIPESSEGSFYEGQVDIIIMFKHTILVPKYSIYINIKCFILYVEH